MNAASVWLQGNGPEIVVLTFLALGLALGYLFFSVARAIIRSGRREGQSC